MIRKLAIVGCAGIPNQYGGFEELAEQLAARAHEQPNLDMVVYCSGRERSTRHRDLPPAVALRFVNLPPHGPGAVLYDLLSFIDATLFQRARYILILGVSAAIPICIAAMLFPTLKIYINVDGREWRREKWGAMARAFLWLSERIAILSRATIIVDNAHLMSEFKAQHSGAQLAEIAYGGDGFKGSTNARASFDRDLAYMAMARIEPENNVHTILAAAVKAQRPVSFVGNFGANSYGRKLLRRYSSLTEMNLYGPVYNRVKLEQIRSQHSVYIHGHSAGGTNPSLVEAMCRGQCVIAFDCEYNRSTTKNQALFFKDSDDLASIISNLSCTEAAAIGNTLFRIACDLYRWDVIAEEYFNLLLRDDRKTVI